MEQTYRLSHPAGLILNPEHSQCGFTGELFFRKNLECSSICCLHVPVFVFTIIHEGSKMENKQKI